MEHPRILRPAPQPLYLYRVAHLFGHVYFLAVCMVWENWHGLMGIYILDARPHLQRFTCTDVMESLKFCPLVGDNTSWVVGSWATLV